MPLFEPSSSPVTLRDGTADDVAATHAIYAHHVLTGLATFEEVPPDPAEMERRRREVQGLGLPWIVAEAQGQLLGYAYAGPYRARPAYRHTVEDSIYLAANASGRGTGSLLLEALIERCSAVGRRQMVAVIGDSANAASIGVHRKQGFALVGVMTSVGFKFGRWVDTVLMQRPLGPGDTAPPNSSGR